MIESTVEFREFTHDDIVEALLELVDEGTLEMGVDLDGSSVWWFREEVIAQESLESLAVGY